MIYSVFKVLPRLWCITFEFLVSRHVQCIWLTTLNNTSVSNSGVHFDKYNEWRDLPLSCRRDGRPGRRCVEKSRQECWECRRLRPPSAVRACAGSFWLCRMWSAAEELEQSPLAPETALAVTSSGLTSHPGRLSAMPSGPNFCWGPARRQRAQGCVEKLTNSSC